MCLLGTYQKSNKPLRSIFSQLEYKKCITCILHADHWPMCTCDDLLSDLLSDILICVLVMVRRHIWIKLRSLKSPNCFMVHYGSGLSTYVGLLLLILHKCPTNVATDEKEKSMSPAVQWFFIHLGREFDFLPGQTPTFPVLGQRRHDTLMWAHTKCTGLLKTYQRKVSLKMRYELKPF